MPNIRQAARRVATAEKANSKNRKDRSMMRTTIKSCLTAIQENNIDGARALFTKIQSILDTLAKKNVISKNKANRLKSRINTKIKAA